MMRFREHGLVVGKMPTGEHNAITDVIGVQVGHTTVITGEAVRTGVTAILPHGGNLFEEKVPASVCTINGFGKALGFEQVRELGVIESPIMLTNTLNVGLVSDACIAYMLQENPTMQSINVVVGETNDGFLNDIQGRHVNQSHVWQAITTATGGAVPEGCVGAGTGTSCYQFKGGIGTSSRRTVTNYTLGVLLQTNFGLRHELLMLGIPIGQQVLTTDLPKTGDGSVMIVIATDAPLDARQLNRIARRAVFGLARTGTIGHHGSGDFVIAFSTVQKPSYLTDGEVIDELFQATVECVEEAIYNALMVAETMNGRNGNTLYCFPHDSLKDVLNYRHFS